MAKLNDINRIYFIGIGGIGMSALARYFRFRGKEVSGYDRTETPLTRELEEEGIAIHYQEDPALAPKDVQLVVYTPAIPKEQIELQYYREHGYLLMKRSEVLGLITESSFNICVAGTHGKTTISTLIAHILRHSGYGCNAFLGGISVNYESNFWSSERNVCVVEADEYDRSFLKLSPDIAVITAMDADHLEIYGTEEAMKQAFVDFSGRLKSKGILISKAGLSRDSDLRGDRHIRYSLDDENADIKARNIKTVNGSYLYEVIGNDWEIGDVRLNMGGLHNVENSLPAITVAYSLGIGDRKIRDAIDAFRGVKRRFEYIIKQGQVIYVDDYAHHPEELKALITSAKGLFPSMTCTVIFQPHLFSRTRDLADGFARSLDRADEVILLPIYPAREMPMPGVSSAMIYEKMKNRNKFLMTKKELLENIGQRKRGLIITAGAGDIDALVEPIREKLIN
jgi:UDP-N-acetylmuramate--alanine ligase